MDKMFVYIKGIVISLIVTFGGILIFSIFLEKNNISENYIDTVIIIIAGISIFVGSFFSTNRQGKRGFITGIAVASIYMFSIYIISSIVVSNFSVNFNTILMFLIGEILGALGGILSVNIKS